jgi:hypothetical protein
MDTPRFLYHGHAVGVSGRITRPFEETIAVQAPSALPTSGGYSSARQEPYRLREVFSHKGARTEATGSHSPKTETHDTAVTATVDGFNLCDVVLADSFTARITSVHPAGKPGEPRITPQGSMFHKLRIAGKDIILESKVDDYDKLDSIGKLREHYKSNAQFREGFRRDASSFGFRVGACGLEGAFVGMRSGGGRDKIVWLYFREGFPARTVRSRRLSKIG